MAYTDHHAHKSLAGVTGVALVHVALAFGLVAGLTIKYTVEEPPPPITGETYIEVPIPIPDPVDIPEPVDPTETTQVERPVSPPSPTIPLGPPVGPIFDPEIISNTGTTVLTLPPVSGGGTVIDPPPAFTATGAAPSNGPVGWVTTNDYPLRALTRGWEGTLTYALEVNSRGRVEDCRVLTSSGHQVLDDTACRMITRRARFDPAINANGNEVAGTYRGTVAWVIPED